MRNRIFSPLPPEFKKKHASLPAIARWTLKESGVCLFSPVKHFPKLTYQAMPEELIKQAAYFDTININLQIYDVFKQFFSTRFSHLKTLNVLSLACGRCHEYPVMNILCKIHGIKLNFIGAEIKNTTWYSTYWQQFRRDSNFNILSPIDCSNYKELETALRACPKNPLSEGGFDFILLRNPEILVKNNTLPFANMISPVGAYFAKSHATFYVSCYLKEELKLVRYYAERARVYAHPVRYKTPNPAAVIEGIFQTERYSIIYDCKGYGLRKGPFFPIVLSENSTAEREIQVARMYDWASRKPRGRGASCISVQQATEFFHDKSILRYLATVEDEKGGVEKLAFSLHVPNKEGDPGLLDFIFTYPDLLPYLFETLAKDKEASSYLLSALKLQDIERGTTLLQAVFDCASKESIPALLKSLAKMPNTAPHLLSAFKCREKLNGRPALTVITYYHPDIIPDLLDLINDLPEASEQIAFILSLPTRQGNALQNIIKDGNPKVLNQAIKTIIDFAEKTDRGKRKMMTEVLPALSTRELSNLICYEEPSLGRPRIRSS